MTLRLAIIGAFTACFSLALCLVANARVVDIFTATAASEPYNPTSTLATDSEQFHSCASGVRGHEWKHDCKCRLEGTVGGQRGQ